jgi:hypothetical protein
LGRQEQVLFSNPKASSAKTSSFFGRNAQTKRRNNVSFEQQPQPNSEACLQLWKARTCTVRPPKGQFGKNQQFFCAELPGVLGWVAADVTSTPHR